MPKKNDRSREAARVDYWPGFGYTSIARISDWFNRGYEKYADENRLKVKAHSRFGRWNASHGMERTNKAI